MPAGFRFRPAPFQKGGPHFLNAHQITIELFGVARLRAGVAEMQVDVPAIPCRLGDVFHFLQSHQPALGEVLFDKGQLRKEFVCNISGKNFTRARDYEILIGDSVLIMSSDAGG